MRSGQKVGALGVVAGVLTIVGPLVATLGLVAPIAGFVLFAGAGVLAVGPAPGAGGPLGAPLGLVAPIVGFVLFAGGGILAVVLALVAIVRLVRGRGLNLGGAVSLLVALGFVGLIVAGGDHPRINDFTTDTNDPPA